MKTPKQICINLADDAVLPTAQKLAEIFTAIIKERQFQDAKYGPILKNDIGPGQGPGGHELAAWLLIIEKELEEAKDAAIRGRKLPPVGRNTVRSELVQVAAVCVAALEQHGVEE